jgi:hypothetical protein
MKLTLFYCDKARNRPDGKLDLEGVFNELYAPGFPARQDNIVLAGVIVWERTDDGQQPFQIEIEDPAGETVFTIKGHTEVDARPQHRPPARTCLVLPLEKVIFPEAGEYPTRIRIKDELLAGPSLHLMETQGEP